MDVYMDEMVRVCRSCGRRKARGQFRWKDARHVVRRSECRECEVVGHRARVHNRAERMRGRGKFSAGAGVEKWIVQSGRWGCGCGRDWRGVGYHVDHVVAVARGGRNDRWNIQLLAPICNLRKSSK